MPRLIILGRGGVLDANRVVAIAPFRSKPVKRLLEAAGPEKVLNLTYGYPRVSIVVLDNGFLAITSRTVGELTRAFDHDSGELTDDNQPPWWS